MCQIENAKPSDFLNIAALDRIAWKHTGEQFIADGEHAWRVWCEYATLLVARSKGAAQLDDSGEIAGVALMFPTDQHEIFLHKIMVHPAVRGGGIGTRRMRAALELATGPVLLTVDPANSAAVQLYRNFCFQVREKIKGYYRAHEDRYLMVYKI